MQLHEHDIAHQCLGQIGVLAQRKSHVLEHAHVGKQSAKLEQHAHATPCGIKLRHFHTPHILAVKQHLAPGALLAANQAQYGGLAAARGAMMAVTLPRGTDNDKPRSTGCAP